MEITGTFEIAKLALNEDDILVVKTELMLTTEQVARIRENVHRYIPAGIKVLVLAGPLSLSVLKHDACRRFQTNGD